MLFALGESTVKGFATMLILTIFVTMITMVLFNRYILGLIINTHIFDKNIVSLVGKIKEHKKHNFINFGLKYACFVIFVLIVSVFCYFLKGVNYGIDFKGGTSIILKSDENIKKDNVTNVLNEYQILSIDRINNNELNIKLNTVLENEEMKNIKAEFEKFNYNSDISVISNIVKKELAKNAIKALIFAIIGILIYVAIRFTPSFSIAGILALLSDVIITIAIFLIFNIEINFIFVAALLTIIGYSINDTIVIFDIIREKSKEILKSNFVDKGSLEEIVNDTVKVAFTRSILTTITTILAVLILLILNASEIRNFNIAILVGLVFGSLSSLFMAPKLWVIFTLKNINRPKKTEEDDEIEEKLIKGINS